MIPQWLPDDFPLWLVFVAPAIGLATLGLIGLWKLMEPSSRQPPQLPRPARNRPPTESSSIQAKSTITCPQPPQPDARTVVAEAGRRREDSRAARKPSQPRARRRSEKRGALRRNGNPIPVLISADAAAEPVPGSVLDRSRGGMSLLTASALPLGVVVRVRSMQYADVAPWVEVEVKHCRPAGGKWLLGCKFNQPQPWNVLLLFG
jgi:hypothetical protein